MRFTHTADCHLGGHRNPKLRQLSEQAFSQFITETIDVKADFCLIAGDLFHTAIPGIDTLRFTVEQLQRLRAANITVYAIPGSHDFSPNGKSMLDVLNKAELLVNVSRYEERDGKLHLLPVKDTTGVQIVGIEGRRGMLDKKLYEQLAPLPAGDTIFLFHTAIEGSTPEGMSGMPTRLLPKGCLYYAGGHIHIVAKSDNIVYPGPLFPNSFSELAELQHGGYWLFDNGTITRKDILTKRVVHVHVDVNGNTSEEAKQRLTQAIDQDVQDAIVLLRVTGTLSDGRPGDIDLRTTAITLEQRGAYTVLRRTIGLVRTAFAQETIERQSEDMEQMMLDEHREQLAMEGRDGVRLAKSLLHDLSVEQLDGEAKRAYEERVLKTGEKLLRERA